MTSWTVYKHLDADGVPIYVGCTSNLDERTRDHASGSPWWGEVASVAVAALIADRKSALQCERDLITLLQPRHNDVYTRNQPTPRPVKVRRPPLPARTLASKNVVWVILLTGSRTHGLTERTRTLCGMVLDWRRVFVTDDPNDEHMPRCRPCNMAALEIDRRVGAPVEWAPGFDMEAALAEIDADAATAQSLRASAST